MAYYRSLHVSRHVPQHEINRKCCSAISPHNTAMGCTRMKGHQGVHVAAGGPESVYEVWGDDGMPHVHVGLIAVGRVAG